MTLLIVRRASLGYAPNTPCYAMFRSTCLRAQFAAFSELTGAVKQR